MVMPEQESYQSRLLVPQHYHRQAIPTPSNYLEDKSSQSRNDRTGNSNKQLVTKNQHQNQPTHESGSFLPYSTFFDFLDAILLFSCFRGVPVADADRSLTNTTSKRHKVVIKVEATVVKADKDALRTAKASAWRKQFDIDMKLAESVFVGTVDDFEQKKNERLPLSALNTPTGTIRKGTLVTSFRKCATKARIVAVPVEELISLSQFQDLDSGEIATVVSSYLPAFGALYHGIDLRLRENRFTTAPLLNFQVLISGGSAIEAEAVTKLALIGGASRVFAYQVSNLPKVLSPKLVVLDGLPKEYLSGLHQSIDVIIDLSYLQDIDFLKQIVATGGRLVCVVPQNQSKNLLSRVKEMLMQATLIKHPGTTVYDFDDMCKISYGEVLRDLRYLLNLTQRRRLRPRVDRNIKSRDVEIMQEDMAAHPPRGTVICEPWREFTAEQQSQSSFQEHLERFCANTLRIEG